MCTVIKNQLSTCVPLSVRRNVDMPYEISQWPMKRFAICVAVVFDLGTVRANLE